MSGHQSAVILAFPKKTPLPASDPAPEPAQERLAQALAGLNKALADQREAFIAWRAALAELRETAGGLHGSLQAYEETLGGLATGVGALHAEARRLERSAEIAERQTAR